MKRTLILAGGAILVWAGAAALQPSFEHGVISSVNPISGVLILSNGHAFHFENAARLQGLVAGKSVTIGYREQNGGLVGISFQLDDPVRNSQPAANVGNGGSSNGSGNHGNGNGGNGNGNGGSGNGGNGNGNGAGGNGA